jgi:hypothetical protein
LIPALPVMFFTLSSAVMLAWNAACGALCGRDPKT